jgi:hypothetical protein
MAPALRQSLRNMNKARQPGEPHGDTCLQV